MLTVSSSTRTESAGCRDLPCPWLGVLSWCTVGRQLRTAGSLAPRVGTQVAGAQWHPPTLLLPNPGIPWGLKEVRPGQVTTAKDQGRRGGHAGLALAPAPAARPSGAVLGGGEARKHTESPLPPHLLPLPGSGWGTPIVSLSGSEQTEKRLPGAAGRLTGPSSVSRSADGGASAGLSSPAPLGRRGVLPSARLL